MQGQVGAVYRWVGDRVNDTTERQRVTAPGDPSTILDGQITAPMELDSYGALDLYAGFGKDAWSVRAYVNNVADERAWSSVSPAASALTGAEVPIGAVPTPPHMFGIEFDTPLCDTANGRASSRERVCKSVTFTVVAEHIK